MRCMSDNPRRSISMPAEQWVALDEIAARDGGRSVASVIRLAVAAYTDEYRAGGQAVSADICTCRHQMLPHRRIKGVCPEPR